MELRLPHLKKLEKALSSKLVDYAQVGALEAQFLKLLSSFHMKSKAAIKEINEESNLLISYQKE